MGAFAVASIRGWWRAEGHRLITDEQFAYVNLKPDKFHGEWNYTIHPNA